MVRSLGDRINLGILLFSQEARHHCKMGRVGVPVVQGSPESLNENVVNCPSDFVHQYRNLSIDENACEYF